MTAIGGVNVPAQYVDLINNSARQYNIRPALLAAVIYHESSFNPNARSTAGAIGIAQFEPATAAQYGVNPLNPNSAIPGAAHYLHDLEQRYGSENAALQAYNSGSPRGAPGYAAAVLGLAGGLEGQVTPAGFTAETVGLGSDIAGAITGLFKDVLKYVVYGLEVIAGFWLLIAGAVMLAHKSKTANQLIQSTAKAGKMWKTSEQ